MKSIYPYKIKFLLALFYILSFALNNQCFSQVAILSEEFNNNQGNWDVDSDETESCSIRNGRYFVKVNHDNRWHWFASKSTINNEKNWIIESTIYLDKMFENDYVGLLWGASDAGNMFQVCYFPKTGIFVGYDIEKGKINYMFTPLNNDPIKGTKLKFTLLKSEKYYYCLINNIAVGKAPVTSLYGSKVGIILSGHSEISVENYIIKEVENGNPIIPQIKIKFPSTRENILYYNDLGTTFWLEEEPKIKYVTRQTSVKYRVYTTNDNGEIVGNVKDYDSKTNKLLRKFQALKIDKDWEMEDVLFGEDLNYGIDGNVEFKIIYFNPDKLPVHLFNKSPTINVYRFDNKERINLYAEIKDSTLKREIYFDENGNITRAQNFSDIYYFERNNFGKYDKVFEENFNPPILDFLEGDISTSYSKFTNDGYYIYAREGDAGRLSKVGVDFNNKDFSVSASVSFSTEGSASIIIGSDNKGLNYSVFGVSYNGQYTIYNVYNGVRVPLLEWTRNEFKKSSPYVLDIIKMGDKIIYSVNGHQVKLADYFPAQRNSIGLNVIGIGAKVTFSKLVIKENNITLPGEFEEFNSKSNDDGFTASGTGFFIATSGYIVTNNHVIENAKEIYVDVTENGIVKTFRATLIKTDAKNDLAVLKINATTTYIPFPLNPGLIDVGSKVFTLGFPYALSYLGKEIKFTEGSISSKTGFGNDINTYQISVPVQPGNSGGPLFDSKGNLIGIVNAKFTKGDNVSYAIKSSVLKTFLDNTNIPKLNIQLNPTDVPVVNLIKNLEKYVVLIKIKQ